MRNAFAAAITELARRDHRVVLLSGDIGNRLFDKFKDAAPERFYNCGVAEANMTTVGAGLALCGLRPFTYTITPFTTLRVLEQLRVDVCYHRVPVVVVGTGSGLSYASLGPTHHSCEDVAVLRPFPNLTILCPADAAEVREAVFAAVRLDGPVYIRLGKKGEPAVHTAPPPFTPGKAITVRDGRDVCLLALGTMVAPTLRAAELLGAEGISSRVMSVHTVKPLEGALLAEVFSEFPLVAVVEEHGRIGGLGGAVAEWLAPRWPRPAARFLSFGTPDEFLCASGSQEYARAWAGLTPEAIAVRVRDAVAESARR